MTNPEKSGEQSPDSNVIDYYARERSVADIHAAERLERERRAQKAAARRAWKRAELYFVGLILLAGAFYVGCRLLIVSH